MLSRLRFTSLLMSTTLVALSACDRDPLPEEARDCSFNVDRSEDSALQEGAPEIVIGEGQGSDFFGWEEGEVVERIVGGQGLSMIMPTVRLRGAGQENGCLHVRIYEPTEDPEPTFDYKDEAHEFVTVGDDLEAGPLYVPIDGNELDLRVVVTPIDRSWQSVGRIRVTAQ